MRCRGGSCSAPSTSPWTRCAARRVTRTWPRSRAASGAGSRCAACLLQQPDLLLLDEPTNHLDAESVAWLERFLQDYPGTVVAITHDRYFLDNVAGWILELDRGHGIPWQGNYSSWLEQKQKRLAQEEKQEVARQQTLARELEWIRASPRARQAKSKARITAYEDLLEPGPGPGAGQRPDHDPAGAAPRRRGDRRRAPREGLRRAPADRRPRLSPAARRHRRRDRAERRRQDHAVSHDRRPGAARRRRAARRRHGGARLRRSEPRRPGGEQIGLGGDLGRPRHHPAGQARGQQPRLRRRVQLPRARPAAEGRPALGRRAQPRAPRQAAEGRRQRHPARRADQRPRRRHAARAGGRAARISPAAP